MVLCRALAMVVGFAGEQLVGWPRRLYHPIMAIGALISRAEKLLRAVFSKSRAGERAAGILMALTLPLISLGLTGGCCMCSTAGAGLPGSWRRALCAGAFLPPAASGMLQGR